MTVTVRHKIAILAILLVLPPSIALGCPNSFNANFEGRQALAAELSDMFGRLDRASPNVAPSDLNWLRDELNSGNATRLMNAYDSVVYEKNQAKTMAVVLHNAAVDLVKNLAAPRQIRLMAGDVDREILLWTRIISVLSHNQDMRVFVDLDRKGQLDLSGVFEEQGESLISLCDTVAHSWLEGIVIAHFRGSLEH